MGRSVAAPSVPAAPALADWVAVFESHFDFIFNTLRHLGASPTDAEDLAQEVFLVMWRRRSSFDPSRPLRPWIAGIALRATHEHRRRRRREIAGGLLDRPDEARSQEDSLAGAQLRRLVLDALARVPAKHREVLVMHEIEGLPVPEIARALDVPVFTLYSRLQRGRRLFAKEIRRAEAVAAARPASPAALLAGCQPVPAPAEVRRRVIERVRGLAAGKWPLPAAPARPPRPILPAAAGGALILAGALGLGLSFARPAPAPAAATLARGLVGYWRFDEGRGSAVARDLSGQGNDCRLHRLGGDGAWRAGALGGGLALDGKGWLECPASPGLGALEQELTIAAWVTDGHVVRNYHALVSRQLGVGRQDDFMFGFANGELVFTSHARPGRIERALPAGRGAWYHVAVTRRADGTATLYLDGRELGRGPTRPASLPAAPNPLIIGAAVNGPDTGQTQARFDGGVDELVIYRRALEAREIAALAARQQPPGLPARAAPPGGR